MNGFVLQEALPFAGRASDLRMSFNKSLLDSFCYLLDACEQDFPKDKISKAKNRIEQLDPSLKLSGLLSTLHVIFVNALETGDPKKADQVLTCLVDGNFKTPKLKFLNVSTLDPFYSSFILQDAESEITEKIEVFPLTSEQFKQLTQATEQGISILKNHLPDFYAEFQELVSEILFLHTKGAKQGASVDLFGLIYKSYLHPWDKVTRILEFITHEQAHLYLFLLNNEDPLIHNPLDLNESPLRKEPRPLMGIYHATFVLARVSYVLKKALSLDQIPRDEITYCEEFIDYYDTRFAVGYDVIQKNAEMTPLARNLIESAKKLI